jgi:DNA-binding NarL/FixJ family response regulator
VKTTALAGCAPVWNIGFPFKLGIFKLRQNDEAGFRDIFHKHFFHNETICGVTNMTSSANPRRIAPAGERAARRERTLSRLSSAQVVLDAVPLSCTTFEAETGELLVQNAAFASKFPDSRRRTTRKAFLQRFEDLARLTPRECEVMQHVIAGKFNKVIADVLNISVKTAELHRANMMSKLEVRNVQELVRIALKTR